MPAYLANSTVSPALTSISTRLPLSSTRPGPDRQDRALLGLLAGRVRQHDAALGHFFLRFRLDDHAIAQWLQTDCHMCIESFPTCREGRGHRSRSQVPGLRRLPGLRRAHCRPGYGQQFFERAQVVIDPPVASPYHRSASLSRPEASAARVNVTVVLGPPVRNPT